MRTPHSGLRAAIALLDADLLKKYPLEYQRRREVLQAINFQLKVKTVLDGCNAGHNRIYLDRIEQYLTEHPEYADVTSQRNRRQE